MNDEMDDDKESSAESLLLVTIGDLRKLASASLNDSSLSMWNQGRVVHGKLLLDQNSEPMIDLIRAVCAQAGSPQIAQPILNAVNSLLIGTYKIGQASEAPLDQEQHNNEQRTEAARAARQETSGKEERLDIVREIITELAGGRIQTSRLLKRVNTALKEKGWAEISPKTLLRYKKECEGEAVDNDGQNDIVSSFLRSD